jgi:hypothetical protein
MLPVPLAPQRTVTDEPVLPPVNDPPLTLQVYVFPAVVFVVYVTCLYSQTVVLPVTVGAGVGRIVIEVLTAESQPKLFVCDTLMLPLPFAPHNTVTDEPVFPLVNDPPLTLQV